MIPSYPHHLSRRLAAPCLALLLSAAPQAGAETLRAQLESLARQNGIAIEGLDRIGAEPSRPVGGDAAQRIKVLLADYNFMIVGQGGRIEKLTITSLKDVAPRPRFSGAVRTQRLGMHHQVGMVALNGPNNAEIRTSLLVDTGATTVVLPASMIGMLGFRPEDLQAGTSQTAGGVIQIKTGVLKSVTVGDVTAENVPVSFISDRRLNGTRLLGMSFLNRFRFSLDDEHNELLLLSK